MYIHLKKVKINFDFYSIIFSFFLIILFINSGLEFYS